MRIRECTKIRRYANGVNGKRRAVAMRIGTEMRIGNTSRSQVPGSDAPTAESARHTTPIISRMIGSLRRITST